ncbi:hypothetical protein J6590_087357 [Homalodisca vitripennis]|nr:hypothetical protein J6590_087357 [Homalodisca vitripennis]
MSVDKDGQFFMKCLAASLAAMLPEVRCTVSYSRSWHSDLGVWMSVFTAALLGVTLLVEVLLSDHRPISGHGVTDPLQLRLIEAYTTPVIVKTARRVKFPTATLDQTDCRASHGKHPSNDKLTDCNHSDPRSEVSRLFFHTDRPYHGDGLTPRLVVQLLVKLRDDRLLKFNPVHSSGVRFNLHLSG